jgi:hypothetical protein
MSNVGLESVMFEALKGKFPGYELVHGQSLLYQVLVDEKLQFQPSKPLLPTRGDGAFETDLLVTRVTEPKTPLVVIEIKRSLSTHDVLTYSAKAAKHKNVYPYLRYGIVFSGELPARIPGRFFAHNSALDFAMAISDENDKDFLPQCSKLVVLVQDQIAVSEDLIRLMGGATKVSTFESLLTLK